MPSPAPVATVLLVLGEGSVQQLSGTFLGVIVTIDAVDHSP